VQSLISRTSNGLLSFRLLHDAEIRGLLDGKRCGCGCGGKNSPCMTDNGACKSPFCDVQQNISSILRLHVMNNYHVIAGGGWVYMPNYQSFIKRL
jgi:hypothetical protein